MSDDRAGYSAKTLCDYVRRYFTPGNPVLHRICNGDGRIEVGSRNGTERQDQCNQGCTGGNGVCKQSDRDVSAGQTVAHDAGPDDRSDEEKRPAELCCDATTQSLHSRPIRSISFLMASESRLCSGKQTNRLIRRSSIMYASRKARAI